VFCQSECDPLGDLYLEPSIGKSGAEPKLCAVCIFGPRNGDAALLPQDFEYVSVPA
jgi:hypothetical protein